MSAALAEIIIINPADSKLEEAKTDLKARKEKLIKTDAFYPDHKNIAEKSIIGDVGGYAYMIVGSAANEGEKALIEKVRIKIAERRFLLLFGFIAFRGIFTKFLCVILYYL